MAFQHTTVQLLFLSLRMMCNVQSATAFFMTHVNLLVRTIGEKVNKCLGI
jgi:hypothetical protein